MDDDGYRVPNLDDLVEAAEPNPLLRRVDALCESRSWDELVDLARRCREAYERGKQLWPIAEHIDYRLALEAPAPYAAAVLTPSAGRFAFGPLTEVAASTHTFEELAPHFPSPQVAGVVAAERVLRGEVLTGRPEAHPEVLELPLRIEPWEPGYAVATYRAHEIDAPAPDVGALPLQVEGRAAPGEPLEEPELHRALLDLASTWVTGSAGLAEAAVVDGDAAAAIGALGVGAYRIGAIDPEEAMALMAWAAGSGGAHGRRRGAAGGRSAAWWAATELSGLEWPVSAEELGEELARLRWYRWEPRELAGGWTLHVAVEDPDEGWSAAIAAEDHAAEDPPS